MKRQLDETEKKLANRSLVMLEADIEYLELVQIPSKKFSLDTADIVVRKQKKDIQTEMRALEMQLTEKKDTVEVLKKQLREGVEVIENKREKGGKKL